MASNVAFPNYTAPSGMPSTLGNQTINSNQTWNSDRKYGTLTIGSSATITVSGNIRVECTSDLTIRNSARIVVPTGSTLTLHVGGNAVVRDSAQANNDATGPGRLVMVLYATDKDLTIQDDAVMSAVVRVERDVTIQSNAMFFGSMAVGDDFVAHHEAKIHLDMSLPSVGAALPPARDTRLLNDGGISGGPTTGDTGATSSSGQCIRFDGSNDFVLIPHHDYYLLDSGAVGMWFKPASTSGTRGLFSKDSAGRDSGGQVTIYLSGSAVVAQMESATADNVLTSGNVISANTWYHVMLVWGPDGMKMYLNGSPAASGSYRGGTWTSSGGSGNFEPIVIGADARGSGNLTHAPLTNYFNGRIDDVRIYDYALDAAQVLAVMTNSTLGPSTLPGAVVYDEGESGAALNLYIPDTSKVSWPAEGGLAINQATTIASRVGASKITDALFATNEFAIDIGFVPANTTQAGPARVVAMSGGTSACNFMIGQSGDDVAANVRTSGTTTAGTPSVNWNDGLSTGEHRVILSYDQEKVRIFHGGTLVQTLDRTGTLNNWSNAYKLVVGNEPTNDRPWLGTFKHLKIYDRAFNQIQVNNVMLGKDPGNGLQETFLVQWVERN